ncbi:MAG: hypothetical protein A2505_06500 [Deltaproteobacteria bacterium RIFOXYD12_FULL_55_16]|nr:MAG: hypothetical protein A2505_06500 [Deltaproteobacteria bacterium RIFOXYD12_FULL_55_16]
MYLDHFGLSQPPFKITPNTGFFYIGGNRGAILEALLYAIIHGEGIVKVTGEIGSGKTMLCRMLESLLPKNVEAIYLINPSLNRDDVFHVIASELRLPTLGKRPSETLHLIQDYLIEKHAIGKQVVLLVEEAQAMPLDTLEEIRLLSNLETAHHKLLQIVLFGQPDLDENLALPRMRQLKERITHSFTVPPLTPANIPEYLMFRLRAAGYHGPEIFSQGALKLIAAASMGVTRRINVLADKTLLAAFSENTHNLRSRHVKAAIKDCDFAVLDRSLPWQRLCFAAALLGLGIVIGIAWQYLANLPRHTEMSAPQVIQTTSARAVQPPLQEKSLPVLVPAATSHSLLQQKLAATQAWLAKEDDGNFTVQLMLLSDTDTEAQIETVLQKLARETELARIYVYPTRITPDHQFIRITFGSFSSQEQALAAFAKLPAAYQRNGPILRTVKGIRQEIANQ